MIRRLLNFLTQLFGWSPVGKRVVLRMGEGPWADALAGRLGRIEMARSTGRGKEVITLVLSEDCVRDGDFVAKVLLIPRHTDYGSIALKTTCIAAYVCTAKNELVGLPREEDILAVMDVCLAT